MTDHAPAIPPTLAAALALPDGRVRAHALLRRCFEELAGLLRADVECVALIDDGRPRPTLNDGEVAFLSRTAALLRDIEALIGRQEVDPDWLREAIDAPERLASGEGAA